METRQLLSRSRHRSVDSIPMPVRVLLIFGLLCLASTASVWRFVLNSPSDGARMSKLPQATNSEGVFIDVLAENSPLRNGDLVISVQGKLMSGWVEELWRPSAWGSPWKFGDTIHYGVVRQGVQIDVPVILAGQPIHSVLLRNWSVLLYTLIFQLIAIVILILKPRDPAAQALFLWGMTTSHFYLWSSYHQIYDFVTGFGFWLYVSVASFLWVSSWVAGLHLALTFPSPLPRLRRRPILIWMLYPISYFLYILYLSISRKMSTSDLAWIGNWNRGDTLMAIALFIPSVIVMIRQYRLHPSGPERLKIQWVIYGALFAGSTAMILYLVPEFLGLSRIGVNIVGLLLLPFPLAIALAIWRYQLFDINLIIHRTLVYGTLSVILSLVFFGSVALLQAVFSAVSGQQSAVSIVISTLLITAFFNPLRNRIQTIIDRRFFRSKYDAQKILERFSATARSEVELDRLCQAVVSMVNDTLQPEQAFLWLRPDRKIT